MIRSEECIATGRRLLRALREEFRSQGYGEMRRISRELGLPPDYLSILISKGKMDVGTFFAALRRLDVSPAVFFLDALDGLPDLGPPKAPLKVQENALEAFYGSLDEEGENG